MTPLDSALTPAELRAALGLAVSTFFKYQAMGKFEAWELTPRIGPRRYSRKAVQAYLDGEQERASVRIFSRKKAAVAG